MSDNPFPQSCAERFQAVKLLGTGGFGAVWLAEQKDLGRLVAVKTSLSSQIPDQDHINRFIQEAKATSRLEHPHIVRLIDYGVEGHRPWLVYEYIEGQSVSDQLRQHTVSWQEAVRIIRETASGLAYAHENGIIHRDIKPDNLLLDSSGSLKIIDFGIAKWNSRQGVQTEWGLVLGTIEYMSPDQLRGNESSPQFDLYSLGVTFFQMLTGRLPFTHESKQEVIRMHLKVLAPVPSSVVPGLPATLDRIVSTCLAKTEKNRYPGMKDLIEELDALEVTSSASPSATLDVSISRSSVSRMRTSVTGRTSTRTSMATAKVAARELNPGGPMVPLIVTCITCLALGSLGAWMALRDARDPAILPPPPPISSSPGTPAPSPGVRDPALLDAMQALREEILVIANSIHEMRKPRMVAVEDMMVVEDLSAVHKFHSKIRLQIDDFAQVFERMKGRSDDDWWWQDLHDTATAILATLGELKGTTRVSDLPRSMQKDTLTRLRTVLEGEVGAEGTVRELTMRHLRMELSSDSREMGLDPVISPGWPTVFGQSEGVPVFLKLLELLENPQDTRFTLDPWERLHYIARISKLYLAAGYAFQGTAEEQKVSGVWKPSPGYVKRVQRLIESALPFSRDPAGWMGTPERLIHFFDSSVRGVTDAMRADWGSVEHRPLLVKARVVLDGVSLHCAKDVAGVSQQSMKEVRASMRSLEKSLSEVEKFLRIHEK